MVDKVITIWYSTYFTVLQTILAPDGADLLEANQAIVVLAAHRVVITYFLLPEVHDLYHQIITCNNKVPHPIKQI